MATQLRNKQCLRLSQVNLATISLVVASLVGLFPTTSAGQQANELVGHRVQVVSIDRSFEKMIGVFLRAEADSIVIRQTSNENMALEVSMALSTIGGIDVSRGKLSNARLGALIGAGVGLGGGLLMVADRDDICEENPLKEFLFLCDEGFQVFEVVIYTVFGALAGAGIGSLIKTEKWNSIDISQFAIKPSLNLDGQIGMQISLNF